MSKIYCNASRPPCPPDMVSLGHLVQSRCHLPALQVGQSISHRNQCVCPANKALAHKQEAGCSRTAHGAREAKMTRSSSTGVPQMHVVVGDLLLLHIPTSLSDNTESRSVFFSLRSSSRSTRANGMDNPPAHRPSGPIIPRSASLPTNQPEIGCAHARLVFADGYFSPSLAPMLERRRLALWHFFSGPTLAERSF
jgi:hypothetical protein